MKFYIDT